MPKADEITHFFFGSYNKNLANQTIEIRKMNSTPSEKFPLKIGAFCRITKGKMHSKMALLKKYKFFKEMNFH